MKLYEGTENKKHGEVEFVLSLQFILHTFIVTFFVKKVSVHFT